MVFPGGVEYTRMPCNEKGQLVLFDPLKGEKGFDAVEKLLRPNTKAVIVNHAQRSAEPFCRQRKLLSLPEDRAACDRQCGPDGRLRSDFYEYMGR